MLQKLSGVLLKCLSSKFILWPYVYYCKCVHPFSKIQSNYKCLYIIRCDQYIYLKMLLVRNGIYMHVFHGGIFIFFCGLGRDVKS
jgi:hypothetical protein